MYSIATNTPKKSSDVPKSFIATSRRSAAPSIASRGASCRSGGNPTPSTRSGVCARSSRLLAQVAGEEQHEQDLRELGRLEADRPPTRIHTARAVDHGAGRVGRQDREREQRERERAAQIAVALEHAEVGQQHQHGDEHRDADRDPQGLVARERGPIR